MNDLTASLADVYTYSYTVSLADLYEMSDQSNYGKTPFTNQNDKMMDLYNLYITKSGDNYTVKAGRYAESNFATGTGDKEITVFTRSGTDAIRAATAQFVYELSKKADDNGNPLHRVAIVSYANGAPTDFTGSNYQNTGIWNDGSMTGYTSAINNQNVLSNALHPANDKGLIKSAINFDPSKAQYTYPDYGMELANKILNTRTATEKAKRQAVVIMFSDGQPGNDTGDATRVANRTLAQAYNLKKAVKDGGQNALVYTIGLFRPINPPLNNNTRDTLTLGGTENTHSCTVGNFMDAVSSNFPSVQSMDDWYTAKDNDHPTRYYQKITKTDGNYTLNDVFNQVQEDITAVKLDAAAVLKDQFNTANFDFSNATVTVETVKGSQSTEGGNVVFDENTRTDVTSSMTITPATINATTTEVSVKGFDYGANFIGFGKKANTAEGTAANQGKKLVVKISGLLPLKAGPRLESNNQAGIYDKNGSPAKTVASPWKPVGETTIVIDYNYPIKLTESISSSENARINDVKNPFDKGATSFGGHNGTYKLDGSKLTYRLNDALMNPSIPPVNGTAEGNVTINGTFTGVDKALIFEKENATNYGWRSVTTLPATSVYYADSLTAEQTTMKGDGSSDVAKTNAKAFDVPADETTGAAAYGKKVDYTFTGTGIDVYSTTTQNAGYVIAQLTSTKEGFAPQSKMVLNRSTEDRYNTPSVWFTGLEYGTYTLTLYAAKGADFLLDGIRVYNPAGTNADANEIYGDETLDLNEQNATYTTVRDLLITDNTGVLLVDGQKQNLDGIGYYTDKGGAASGAWQEQKDEDGHTVIGEDGKPVVVWNSEA